MRREEAVREFMETVFPAVQAMYESDGREDKPARRLAWNNFTDALCKEGRITDQQYHCWEGPFG